jgi:kynurenine formamidase
MTGSSANSQRPRYQDLPVDPRQPPRAAWGVFGSEDQVGTINWLTPERVVAAARLVRKGVVFSLNWAIEFPDPPVLGRSGFHHHIIDLNPGTDDYYDNYYPQGSTQWDALCHMPHPDYGYYNGVQRRDITGRPGSRNGIEHWARRGIVGRFVLADVERYMAGQGQPIDASDRVPVTADMLEATITHQGVTLQGGDILLVRCGWISWYEERTAEERQALARARIAIRTPGLAAEDRTLEWLWDHEIAAVASDVPGLEALPYTPTPEGFLHYNIIPLLGMAVGEMFALDALADDCRQDGVYEGLFTAAPLNKTGGSGSPGNALAIK